MLELCAIPLTRESFELTSELFDLLGHLLLPATGAARGSLGLPPTCAVVASAAVGFEDLPEPAPAVGFEDLEDPAPAEPAEEDDTGRDKERKPLFGSATPRLPTLSDDPEKA